MGNELVHTAGDTLGVAKVLEGSVQRVGSRFRVFAQLLDARRGCHLRFETYERELADVLAGQDEITGAIGAARELRLLLSPTARHVQIVVAS